MTCLSSMIRVSDVLFATPHILPDCMLRQEFSPKARRWLRVPLKFSTSSATANLEDWLSANMQPQPLTETGSCSLYWKSEHVAIQSWAKRLTSDNARITAACGRAPQACYTVFSQAQCSDASVSQSGGSSACMRSACVKRCVSPPSRLLKGRSHKHSMKF